MFSTNLLESLSIQVWNITSVFFGTIKTLVASMKLLSQVKRKLFDSIFKAAKLLATFSIPHVYPLSETPFIS